MTTDPFASSPSSLARPSSVWWNLQTARGAPSALGIIGLGTMDPWGDSLDGKLIELGIGSVPDGSMRLARIAGVDTGLVVRWSRTRADLFPHGGAAVIGAILARLTELGVLEDPEPNPIETYPEARTEIEARMLEALSRAPSSRAIEVLLRQPERWAGIDPGELEESACAPSELGRLIDPPLVVAVGAPNIGKSSLANALAGRAAAVVADEPGTTRDHVGLTLELDGLAVRYLDTPGLDPEQPDELTAEGSRRAMELAEQADLILVCVDAGDPETDLAWCNRDSVSPKVGIIRVALRADRESAKPASREGVVRTSAATGLGLGELAGAVRRALVPDSALCDPRPWRFWQRA